MELEETFFFAIEGSEIWLIVDEKSIGEAEGLWEGGEDNNNVR